MPRKLSPTDPEMMALLDAAGLVLAEDLLADRDFPPFPRSTRDGFAVRAVDVRKFPAKLSAWARSRQAQRSRKANSTVAPGEAVEIMTGAPVPRDADAVVMVEYHGFHRAR